MFWSPWGLVGFVPGYWGNYWILWQDSSLSSDKDLGGFCWLEMSQWYSNLQKKVWGKSQGICNGLGMVLPTSVLPSRLSKSQATLSLFRFPSHSQLWWGRVENWRHKRWSSRVKLRTIYWKQWWNKRISNRNKINNKSVWKRERFTCQNVHCGAYNLTALMSSWAEKSPSFWKVTPFTLPLAMSWYRITAGS